jgi:hypothetical protein
MLRFALSGVALAAVLAMPQSIFADPLAATASDYAQTPADAIEQPAWSWSSDARASADVAVNTVGMPLPWEARAGMSFIVAGGVLLWALLAGVVLDGIGVRKPKARRDIPDL